MQILGLTLRDGDHIVLRRFGKNKVVRVIADTIASERSGWRVKVYPVMVATEPWLVLHLERIETYLGKRRRGNTLFLALHAAFTPTWLHAFVGRPQFRIFDDKKQAGEFVHSHPDISLKTRLAVMMHRCRRRFC